MDETAWARRGWTVVWRPTLINPGGRRRRYWGRTGADGVTGLHPGGATPPRTWTEPHYSVTGTDVFRAAGHPDGPSARPVYVVRRYRLVCPISADPGDPAGRAHYEARRIRARGVGVVVRVNPARAGARR